MIEEGQVSAGQNATIGGRYSILSQLRVGLFGNIFMARDAANKDVVVAMEIVAQPLCSQHAFLQNLFRDLNAMHAVNHQNVLRILDAGNDNGQYYYTMELVRARPLSELILETENEGPLPWARIRGIFQQLCHGLKEIHSKGILLPIFQTEQILIDSKDRIKYINYGFQLDTLSFVRNSATEQQAQFYAAPEVLEGRQLTVQSNLYSLGAVFSELAIGLPKKTRRSSTPTERRKAASFVGHRKDAPAWAELALKKLAAQSPNERMAKVDSVIQLIPTATQEINLEQALESEDAREASGLRPCVAPSAPRKRNKSMQILLDAFTKPKDHSNESMRGRSLRMMYKNGKLSVDMPGYKSGTHKVVTAGKSNSSWKMYSGIFGSLVVLAILARIFF